MKTTTKKTTLPKKPVTKRDKHFYDMGAEQQAKVFEQFSNPWSSRYGYTPYKEDDKWEQWSRQSLGDRQEPITNEKDYTWQMVSIVVFVGIILLAHPYIMSVLN